MNIAIDNNDHFIYESKSSYGHPLWPSPLLFQVNIQSEQVKIFKAQKFNDFAPNSLLFREDTYNSSSRIRRGRLYKGGETQGIEWHVFPHPAVEGEKRKAEINGGFIKKQVYWYASFRLKPYLKEKGIKDPIFLLGIADSFTIWTLINIETSATGDDIVTLRARKSIGAMPNIFREKFVELRGERTLELIDKLEEEIFVASPESVIDRSREVATAILSMHLVNAGKIKTGKDLAELAKKLEQADFKIAAWSANIIARLHARGKNAEQEKRALRKITEQDAEYALLAVGTILCDLGLAEWRYT